MTWWEGAAEGIPNARPNWMEVDSGAFAHNLGALRRQVGPAVKIFVALKANAYGFGLVPAARAISAAGAHGLSVVDVADAVIVRKSGVGVPILLYAGNQMVPETVEAAIRFDLILTVHDTTSMECVLAHARTPIRVFVEVNTGAERLGVEPDEALDTIARLRTSPQVEVAGVYTHMHVPGNEAAEPHLDWEFARFEEVLHALDNARVKIPIRMAASSKVLVVTNRMNLGAIDPGSVVYGLDPGGARKLDLGVRPAFRAIKSRLVQVRALRRPGGQNEHAPFPVREGMRVGVFPLGRSDGLRTLHCGEVLVRGRRAKILGALSSEHTKIDLTDIADAAVGDEVVIVGPQGKETITVAEVLRRNPGLQESDITRGLSRAVPRVYV
ncbi:MAG: alanine racemase [Proteobacteria bacterium]|nr:alanine racemase [Pseudomonadota bacterium]